MRYPQIVFDFDGTLADSLETAVAIFQKLAPILGLRPIEDLEAARGLTSRQLVKRLGVRLWQLPRVVRAFRAEAIRHAPSLPLHPGVPAMLRELTDRGHKLGIVSSNGADAIRECLRRHGVEQHFRFVAGTPSVFGKRRVIRAALRAEGVSPRRAIYVGDETRDIEAGRRAGLDTVGATWGFHPRSVLLTESPTWLAGDPSEIPWLVSGSAPVLRPLISA